MAPLEPEFLAPERKPEFILVAWFKVACGIGAADGAGNSKAVGS